MAAPLAHTILFVIIMTTEVLVSGEAVDKTIPGAHVQGKRSRPYCRCCKRQ